MRSRKQRATAKETRGIFFKYTYTQGKLPENKYLQRSFYPFGDVNGKRTSARRCFDVREKLNERGRRYGL